MSGFGIKDLGDSARSHLPPPHPPYSGLAISAQARLEQSELVTSGVGWATKD